MIILYRKLEYSDKLHILIIILISQIYLIYAEVLSYQKFCYCSLISLQDIKYDALFKADTFNIKATDFYLEPLATLLCVGTGLDSKPGDGTVDGAGGGHASQGGGSKYNMKRCPHFSYL